MELQIIGSSSAIPNEGSATSAYLIRGDGYTILVECGHGAVGKLRQYMNIAALDAVVISHMHPDHCWDLVALRNYLYIRQISSIPLFLPGNGPRILRRIAVAMEQSKDYFDGTFTIREYNPSSPFRVGPFHFGALRTLHNIEANALSITDEAGHLVVFTSDTAWFTELAEFARRCDLLITEVTDHMTPPVERRWHMGPNEVVRLVMKAEPRLTILTHYPGEYAHSIREEIASRCHPYAVRLAIEGESHEVGA